MLSDRADLIRMPDKTGPADSTDLIDSADLINPTAPVPNVYI